MSVAVELPPRLAAIAKQRPGIVILSPAQSGARQWRASWLTSVDRGGAEEAKHDDPDGLADYLEGRLGVPKRESAPPE